MLPGPLIFSGPCRSGHEEAQIPTAPDTLGGRWHGSILGWAAYWLGHLVWMDHWTFLSVKKRRYWHASKVASPWRSSPAARECRILQVLTDVCCLLATLLICLMTAMLLGEKWYPAVVLCSLQSSAILNGLSYANYPFAGLLWRSVYSNPSPIF